ncbi:AI-2E family transporter [Nonomuraea roseoviolacea]|uniref:PurR-regulated permease PerM n=1 Tax=Nonomuraea roseoviolacea subsp. carminata TaxID=160689 RepID=A0ABT1JUQ3_9ACTN|nr:AI-2E family transporter [Nonomuraea roseoviolacea]MCP2345162.1 putative PurR-regulated permease PerM [Nonomuraea roseoviolacea subsp. carminata]
MSDQPIPRALIVLLGMAGAVVTLFGMREVASIIGPVVLALVLVIAVAPVRDWLARRGAPLWTQVVIPFVIVLFVLLGMVAILTFAVTELAGLLPAYGPQFQKLLDEAQRLATSVGLSNAKINEALKGIDLGKIVGVVQSLLGSLVNVLSGLFLIVVLLLSMCLDGPVTARILEAGHSSRHMLVSALATFAQKTRQYLIVSTVFGLIVAVLDAIGLAILGVPLPILWGVLALITNYIPNIGFVLGLIPPALLALLDGGPKQMVLVIILYCVINVVIESFIQPKFLGDAVGLSTTMTFLSLILWTFVLGALGALLAIPLSLFARALLVDSDPRATWAAALISGTPPEEPPKAAPPGTPPPVETSVRGPAVAPGPPTSGESAAEGGTAEPTPPR